MGKKASPGMTLALIAFQLRNAGLASLAFVDSKIVNSGRVRGGRGIMDLPDYADGPGPGDQGLRRQMAKLRAAAYATQAR